MAFDFPASPTNGQVYAPSGGPAYQWDGEKWKGGQPSGPQTEQYFDLTGKTSIDLTVPSWAKACKLTGIAFCPTGTQVALQMSADGTTFFTGATDYTSTGPILNTGTSAYQAYGTSTAASAVLTLTSTSVALPHLFTTDLNVERPSTAQQFASKTDGKSHDSNAATGYRSWLSLAALGIALTTSLRLAKLRISNGGGVFTGGSLHVQWLGDAAQVPISNAIPDAPQNGKPWVRRNGVWIPQTGVVQQKVFFDSTDFSRAATTEAVMSVPQTFTPLYPDSTVIFEWVSYATITTTASIDDLRGRLYGKFFDGAVYASAIGNVIMGHVNFGTAANSSVFYGSWLSPPVDVSACRRPPGDTLPGAITIRLYGMADYASVTLDSYDCTMRFTEILN
jgi:hypothetical protein